MHRNVSSLGRGRSRTAPALLAVGALILAACASGTTEVTDTTGAPVPTTEAATTSAPTTLPAPATAPTPTTQPASTAVPTTAAPPSTLGNDSCATPAVSSLGELLRYVPAGTTEVYMSHMARAEAVFSIDRPTRGDVGAEQEYLRQLFSPALDSPSLIGAVPSALEIEAWREELGFAIAGLDMVALTRVGTDEVQIFSPVDAGAVESALGELDGWERVTRECGDTFRFGDDASIDLEARTITNQLGRSRRVGVAGQVAVIAATDEPFEQSMFPGARTTIDYEDIVTVLDDLGAYSVFLSTGVTELDKIRDALGAAFSSEDFPTLTRFLAWGAGATVVDDELRTVLVIENFSPVDATDNLERLRRVFTDGSSLTLRTKWSDRVEIVSIVADGDLIVAVLDVPQGLNLFITALLSGDTFPLVE